ncbi:OprD family porin [Pseudomonas arsenicoxydans]|uniref:OprD family porin n=1 Tax=Pseudomonas arsenicoxydans TaxID=702115 RepID=A0A502HLU4_9PSED|nr:OprD family porin [Pseudomonas arsenicoxydans]TPG74664.1 OprD family porin [Pseudomonas arsenicoxydans]
MKNPALCLCLLCVGRLHAAEAVPTEGSGFLEGATLNVLSRNFFLNSDNRSAKASQNYQREWAQGFITTFESGFTPGAIGFGVDAHGFLGFKLDSGKGRSGTGLLPVDSDGEAENDFSDTGGVIKVRAFQTQIKFGEMMVETPVFDTSDKRLQPEYATGWFVESDDLPNVHLVGGKFTAFKNQDSTSSKGEFVGYGVSTDVGSISFVGADFMSNQAFGTRLYASQLTDTWRQLYANVYAKGLNTLVDFNVYRTLDYGRSVVGDINTTAYSLSAKHTVGAQEFTIAAQHIHGDTPFDFVGGDSIYLANSIKFADFNGAHERSYQARYDFDFASMGLPGMKLMTRYVTGRNIDGTHAQQGGAYFPFDPNTQTFVPQQGKGGKHWERDIDLSYTVQSGPAKDLLIHLTHVSHRANEAQGQPDIDRIYFVVEYNFKLL